MEETVFITFVWLVRVEISVLDVCCNDIQVLKQISQQWYPCID